MIPSLRMILYLIVSLTSIRDDKMIHWDKPVKIANLLSLKHTEIQMNCLHSESNQNSVLKQIVA